MTTKKLFHILSFFFFALAWTACSDASSPSGYTQYVNSFIGTGGHGHTYPGATVPHGLVQLSPDTRTNGWDACAGYHFDDKSLIGFSHTHLSGTGIGDLGDFLFLPYTRSLKKVGPNGDDNDSRFGSAFSHGNEMATPGYYKVYLEDYDITAELTATSRVGFHRYTFPQDETPGLYIDLKRTIHNRRLAEWDIDVVNDKEIRGMKRVFGWAPDRYVFFHAEFSKPFEVEEGNAEAILRFKPTKKGDQLLVKVGISFVDWDGAKNNLTTEVAHWDFNKVQKDAKSLWEKELSKVAIETKDHNARTIFYSALYHTALEPVISSDVDGRFRTMENKIEQDKNYTNYTIFSMWDTFRALHPLNTVISSEKNQAMIRSLIRKSEEGGILPMWELASNYTGCMIGYHAVSLIVDSYMKGQQDFDAEKAYRAAVKTSSYDTTGMSPTINARILRNDLMPIGKHYKNTIGYIPADVERQSVAQGLEYVYNDWLIAQFAKQLGKKEDYLHYSELGKNYKHYYDPSTGFMRGKMTDGSWRTPFDPRRSDHNNDDYCEGNAWQWTWFVPHDVDGLAALMGGREILIEKLDSLFSTSSELTGERVSADISGMIGQYAHGNEPSHQTIHIYNQVSQPHKTQELVDQVLQTLYFNDPNGLSGNEDCGQMSAWYVLNSMGFYSHCPGIPYYSIARPMFDNVKIRLENGNVFEINAINNSTTNKYIESAKLNGEELNVLFFSHKDLMNGGVLELVMSDKPKLN